MTKRYGGIDLSGQRILVTGAAQGIGHGLAQTFADWGADVALADLDQVKVDAASHTAAVHAQGRILGLEMNVTDESSVAAAFDRVCLEWDCIDLLVNSAGVLSVANVAEMPLSEWSRIMNVNATGVFLASRAMVQRLQAARRPGSIVSLASIAGKRGDPGLAHYSASKFAVVGFTQALAREVGLHDITVNAICPGVVKTGMIETLEKSTEMSSDAWVSKQAINRPQTPADIAFAAAFLHLSRAITGQSINVDGGSVFN